MNNYTLADLTALTGAKRRTVQLWAEGRAILADKDTEQAGSGTHRRFSHMEAIIALIINPLAKLHMSIGDLVNIGNGLRDMFRGEDNGQSWLSLLDDCINDRREIDLILANSIKGLSITTNLRSPDDSKEAIWQKIGQTVTDREKEVGALSIIIPLNIHLAVLR